MAPASRRLVQAAALLLVLAPLTVHAQLTDVPDLSTATNTGDGTSAQSTGQTSAESTGDETTGRTTGTGVQPTATTDNGNGDTSTGFVATATDGTASVTDAPSLTTSDGTSVFQPITNAPTIAGAGIPELFIPWTAGAPFMQKSSLPEGTVFIAVGGVLAFLGACVILWRGMVAWSINRSVKRAALASVGASEKSTWGGGGGGGYRTVSQKQPSPYKDAGSSMSLDQLTSAGKPMKPHFRDSTIERRDTPPADLFFSPTAKVSNRESMLSHRNSAYMPSGYYASPNSAAAGGATGTTLGGDGSHSIAPYANRNSYISEPSPPSSPGLPPTRSSGAGYRGSRVEPKEGLRAPPSREGRRSYLSAEPRSGHSSALYAQPSSSSLMVGGNSVSDLGGSRAPSAYFEDLLENHGSGPRERF